MGQSSEAHFIHKKNKKREKRAGRKYIARTLCKSIPPTDSSLWLISTCIFLTYDLEKYTHMHLSLSLSQLFHIFPVTLKPCGWIFLLLFPNELSLIAFKKMGVLFNHLNHPRSQRVSFLYLAVGGSAVNSSITHSHRVEMGEREREREKERERRTRVVNTKWFVESDWLYLWVNE